MSIHAQYGIRTIINASGPVTRLGGAPLRSEGLLAFANAAGQACVLEEVHAAASRRICQETLTEAALVTSGAAAGLMLGAAAILCGNNLRRMEELPQLTHGPRTLLVPVGHRHGYDHALRGAGASLRTVGMDEVHAHAGVRRAEVWELEAAIDDDTAGIFYTYHSRAQPPLHDVVQMARRYQLPVLVDAAAQLPPASNLSALAASGADLIVFSGGKAIGGPQATGILCGRRSLVGSAFLQMIDQDDHYDLWDPPPEFVAKGDFAGLPRHGIGRALKVSQEQIFALLAAFEAFTTEPFDEERWLAILKAVELALHGVAVTKQLHLHRGRMPELHITLPAMARRNAFEVCRQLRAEPPYIYVGHARLHDNVLVINPACLQLAQATIVGQRIGEVVR